MEIRSKEITLVKCSELKPNPKNRNIHPKDQIDRLAEIIKYQGFRNPITVSNQSGFIVAGHGRLEAAKQLGIEAVPVIFQDFESEEQEYAAQVSDNAIASWAELDLSGINNDLPELGPDFDIDLLGIENFKLDPSQHLDEKEHIDQEQHIVTVFCKDETDMSIIYDEFSRRGYQCKLIR